MDIKYINIGLQIYGYGINIAYYGFVDTKHNLREVTSNSHWEESNVDMITMYPLGKKFSFMIEYDPTFSLKDDYQFDTSRLFRMNDSNFGKNELEYDGYLDIPVIIYYTDNTIKITDEKKFNRLLEYIINQLDNRKLPIYKNEGIQIEYIDLNHLFNPSKRVTTLINNRSPKQNQLRVLYDTIDQLINPSSNVKIIYECNDAKNNIYIGQIKTKMYYTYGKNYFLFYNDSIGKFKYDIFTGHIDAVFKKQIINDILADYKKSYPDNFKYNVYSDLMKLNTKKLYRNFVIDEYTTNNQNWDNRINISIMALEIDVNFMLDME